MRKRLASVPQSRDDDGQGYLVAASNVPGQGANATLTLFKLNADYTDVTGIVQANGTGDYWGADIAAATGEDRYGGWSLVVVFRNPTMTLRNLTVFDGFADISNGNPATVSISGFLAPRSGPVETQLGMVAYEGDRGSTGDQAVVMLLLDPQNYVTAGVQGEPNAVGLIKAATGQVGILSLELIPNAVRVSEGDIVTTAGFKSSRLASYYPPGIPVGRVTSVSGNDTTGDTKVIQVTPFADFRNITDVIVLEPRR